MAQLNEWQRVIRGIFLSIFLAIATSLLLLLIATALQRLLTPGVSNWVYSANILLAVAGYFVGITQLLYIVPLIILLWRQRRFGLMKGIVIGAVIIALVNFGCYLFVISQFR